MEGHLQAGQAGVIGLGDRKPVDIDAHIVQEFSHLEAVLFRPYGHHLVQGRLDLNAAADKAGGNAAGKVVSLQDQDVQPLVRQHQR